MMPEFPNSATADVDFEELTVEPVNYNVLRLL